MQKTAVNLKRQFKNANSHSTSVEQKMGNHQVS
jgi:hypothetical protein